jgi:hypothetical protein
MNVQTYNGFGKGGSQFTPDTILPALPMTSTTSAAAAQSGLTAFSVWMVPSSASAKTRSWERAEDFKRKSHVLDRSRNYCSFALLRLGFFQDGDVGSRLLALAVARHPPVNVA